MTNRLFKSATLVLALAFVPLVAHAQAMQTVCKDGTKSASAGGGTCSGHGGVDEKATKDFLASGKTVMCTDGAMSAGGRGACSGHGGIGKAKTAAQKELKAEKKEEKKEDKAAMKEAKADQKMAAKAEKRPAKATGKCKDGTYTETKNRQGACTGHGGVGSWF